MRRKLQTRAAPRGGQLSCDRCGQQAKYPKLYGEEVEDGLPAGRHVFTGWRGPYCSAKCYLLTYPEA